MDSSLRKPKLQEQLIIQGDNAITVSAGGTPVLEPVSVAGSTAEALVARMQMAVNFLRSGCSSVQIPLTNNTGSGEGKKEAVFNEYLGEIQKLCGMFRTLTEDGFHATAGETVNLLPGKYNVGGDVAVKIISVFRGTAD